MFSCTAVNLIDNFRCHRLGWAISSVTVSLLLSGYLILAILMVLLRYHKWVFFPLLLTSVKHLFTCSLDTFGVFFLEIPIQDFFWGVKFQLSLSIEDGMSFLILFLVFSIFIATKYNSQFVLWFFFCLFYRLCFYVLIQKSFCSCICMSILISIV